MTSTPLFSVVASSSEAATLEAVAPHASTQLRLLGPMQVHVHLGCGAPGQAGPSPTSTALPHRQRPMLLALAALALAGGGYLAGSRSTSVAPRIEEVSALAADPAPGLLPLSAGSPGSQGELPPALRQQLTRPPVVTPPPGAPTSTTGVTAVAPARNAFGLGN